jgi:hypothetical protein
MGLRDRLRRGLPMAAVEKSFVITDIPAVDALIGQHSHPAILIDLQYL